MKIPIKPHIKKFVLKTLRKQEPITIEHDSIFSIGRTLMSIIKLKEKFKLENNGFRGELIDAYTETLHVKLSREMEKRSPQVRYLVQINPHLEGLFQQALIIWINAQAESGTNSFQATKAFRDFFDIQEEEYTLDATYRLWTRYKNKEARKAKKKIKTRV